jgi:hypothetical protein
VYRCGHRLCHMARQCRQCASGHRQRQTVAGRPGTAEFEENLRKSQIGEYEPRSLAGAVATPAFDPFAQMRLLAQHCATRGGQKQETELNTLSAAQNPVGGSARATAVSVGFRGRLRRRPSPGRPPAPAAGAGPRRRHRGPESISNRSNCTAVVIRTPSPIH